MTRKEAAGVLTAHMIEEAVGRAVKNPGVSGIACSAEEWEEVCKMMAPRPNGLERAIKKIKK